MQIRWIVLFLAFVPSLGLAKPDVELVKVTIGVLAPNAPEATEYNRKFRTGFEGTLFYSIGRNQERAKACGYSFDLRFGYYAFDEKATALSKSVALERSGSWLTIGPDKSDHFLIASQGIKDSMLVSALASSSEVMKLPFPAVSLAEPNSELARVLANAVRDEKFGKSYGVVTDPTCKICTDFSKLFAVEMGDPDFKVDLNDDNFDISETEKKLLEHKSDFLLLPVYSRLAGRTISALKEKFPRLKVVGHDGWGDDKFSFLPRFPVGSEQRGLTVRLGASTSRLESHFNASSLYFSNEVEPSSLVPLASLVHLKLIDNLTSLLCKTRPRSRSAFLEVARKNKDSFKPGLPLAVYELNVGKLRFLREASAK